MNVCAGDDVLGLVFGYEDWYSFVPAFNRFGGLRRVIYSLNELLY